MSQQSILADIASWSPDECRSQLDQALPKLIQFLNEAGALDREAEILQLIYRCFLPVISMELAEDVLFSKVAHKTAKCFDVSLSSIPQVASDADQQLATMTDQALRLLQIGTSLIGCLTSCVSHMIQLEGDLELGRIHSLPASILHVVERSYTHCKESSSIYGELLGAVSDQLSVLFRQANNLQMAFISLLDKARISNTSSEEDVQDMVTAIHGLFEISQVAANLEVKVMLTLWKAISRLSCQHKEVLCNRLELDQMISTLAMDMSATYEYLFTLPPEGDIDQKGAQRRIKILGFQMRVLQTLVKEFDGFVGDGVGHVYKLMLLLQRSVSPCLPSRTAPAWLVGEVENQVVVGLVPLLQALLNSRHFVQSVTKPAQDLKPELYLPHLLTVVVILDHLPNCDECVQSLWLAPRLLPEDEHREGLLTTLFTSLTRCYVELSMPVILPGVMCNGKPQRSVSLYEHVVTRTCGFIASLPSHHFKILETCLLENVLSRPTYSATLATDVWCFLARYGSADICRDHCMMIAHILQQGALNPTPQCCHLVELLRRLLRFMAPEHQEDFLRTFPVDKHPKLWSVVPLAIFTPSLLSAIVPEAVAMTTKVLDTWLISSERTVTDCQTLVCHLRLLSNIYSSTGVAEHHVEDAKQREIVDGCCQLWAVLPPGGVVRYAVLHGVVIALYQITSYLTPYLDAKHLLKLLLLTSRMLTKNPPVSVRLAVLHFMSSLGGSTFPPSTEQPRILAAMPKIFQMLLGDSNAVVHQRALEVFTKFAEETPHESIVPESIDEATNLQDAVVAYLHQVETAGNAPDDPDLLTHIHEAGIKVAEYLSASPTTLYPPLLWPTKEEGVTHHAQPAAKKLKSDGAVSDHQMASSAVAEPQVGYSEALQMVRDGVSQLSLLRRQGAFPSWFHQELQVVQMQLAEFL